MKFQGSELETLYNNYWNGTILPTHHEIDQFIGLVLSNIYYDAMVYTTINALLVKYSSTINSLINSIRNFTGQFSDQDYIKEYLSIIIRQGRQRLDDCSEELSRSNNNTEMLIQSFDRFYDLIKVTPSKSELDPPFTLPFLDSLEDDHDPFALPSP